MHAHCDATFGQQNLDRPHLTSWGQFIVLLLTLVGFGIYTQGSATVLHAGFLTTDGKILDVKTANEQMGWLQSCQNLKPPW